MYDKGPNCHQQGYLLITYRLLSDDASTSVSIRYQLVSLCIKYLLQDGLQIAVNIEHQQKILSAENSQIKEEILKNIKEVIEQHTPKPNIPLSKSV